MAITIIGRSHTPAASPKTTTSPARVGERVRYACWLATKDCTASRRANSASYSLPQAIEAGSATSAAGPWCHNITRRATARGNDTRSSYPAPTPAAGASQTPEPGRMSLTVPEAAHLLHCQRNTVWALVRSGELKSFQLRHRRLIAGAAVEELISSGGTSSEVS